MHCRAPCPPLCGSKAPALIHNLKWLWWTSFVGRCCPATSNDHSHDRGWGLLHGVETTEQLTVWAAIKTYFHGHTQCRMTGRRVNMLYALAGSCTGTPLLFTFTRTGPFVCLCLFESPLRCISRWYKPAHQAFSQMEMLQIITLIFNSKYHIHYACLFSNTRKRSWRMLRNVSLSNFKARPELLSDARCSSRSVQQGNRVVLLLRHVWKLRAI